MWLAVNRRGTRSKIRLGDVRIFSTWADGMDWGPERCKTGKRGIRFQQGGWCGDKVPVAEAARLGIKPGECAEVHLELGKG